MKHYPSLANVVTQADCSQGLNVRSAEGKAITCQSTRLGAQFISRQFLHGPPAAASSRQTASTGAFEANFPVVVNLILSGSWEQPQLLPGNHGRQLSSRGHASLVG